MMEWFAQYMANFRMIDGGVQVDLSYTAVAIMIFIVVMKVRGLVPHRG